MDRCAEVLWEFHSSVICSLSEIAADFARRNFMPHGPIGKEEIRAAITQTLISHVQMNGIPQSLMDEMEIHTKRALEE